MPLTHLELPTSTRQLPNTINPLPGYFKFITAEFSLCFEDKEAEQPSIETTVHIAQQITQLTCIQKVAGLVKRF